MPDWEERARGVWVLNGIQVEGLGPARFVEVRLRGDGAVNRISVYLPFGADFDTFEGLLTEQHGRPSSVLNQTEESDTRMVTWANRTQALWLIQARRVDGRWHVGVDLQTQGQRGRD
jgi:hypothetical protein